MMKRRTCWTIGWMGLFAILPTAPCFAAGGTSVVASPGQDVTSQEHWAKGVAELVNDAARTDGWNPWFSEWPNDVCHYAYDTKTIDDVNRLLEKLGNVNADVRRIHLSHQAEPNALGWVTQLPAGNGIAVLFTLGDQSRIDEWYKHVRKPFGRIEFTDTPVATPPTLNIFVTHPIIDLDQLKIPDGVEVVAGGVPGPFSVWNTKDEQKRRESAENLSEKVQETPLETQPTADRIRAYLQKRAARSP